MTWLHGVNQNGMGKRVIQTRRTQWHTQRHSVPLCAAWARSLSLRRSLSPRPSMSHSHWFWEATRIGSVGNRDSKATTCVCVFVCVCVFNVCLFLSFGLNASLACIASWRATSEKGPTAVLMALGNTHTHTRARRHHSRPPPTNQPLAGCRLGLLLACVATCVRSRGVGVARYSENGLTEDGHRRCGCVARLPCAEAVSVIFIITVASKSG